MKYARGAVLAETALFVSAALLFMLGSIQIGVIGFFQLTSDGASYFDARSHVLSVASGSPEQATHQEFAQIPIPDISATILPAPTPAIPVDYLYNGTAAEQQTSATSRHGGASMLTPAQEIATVKIPGLANILGQGIGANSSETESVWQECGTHFDVANEGCSLAAPGPNSQTDYFAEGENTPPYMVGRNLMKQCNATEPFGIYEGGTTNLPSSSTFPAMNDGRSSPAAAWASPSPCQGSSSSNLGYLAEGTAEFLHSANWGDKGTGGSSSNGGGISGAPDVGGTAQNVFQAVAFHQRTYAALGSFFANHKNLVDLEYWSAIYEYNADASAGSIYTNNQFGNQYNIYVNSGYTDQGFNNLVYKYSETFPPNPIPNSGKTGGTAVAIPEQILTFENWEGFDDAGCGPGNSSSCPGGVSDYYNTLVHYVYSWDVTVQAGEPYQDPTYNNPTNPENNDS